MPDDTFTLMDLIREEYGDVVPIQRVAWELGAKVREAFKDRYGRLPDKALRTKTDGGGSHCFAVYPPEFKAEALAIVKGVLGEVERVMTAQGDLF